MYYYGIEENPVQRIIGEANSTGANIGTSLHSGKFVTGKNGRTRELSLLAADLAEYRFTGYPTRVIFRKEKKEPV